MGILSRMRQAIIDMLVKPYADKYFSEKVFSQYINDTDLIKNEGGYSPRFGNLTYTKIENMMLDSQISTGMRIRKLAIVGRGGRYVNKKNKELAKYINDCLDNMDMSFIHYLEILLSGLEYGWKSMECIWNIDKNGYPFLRGFIDHPQDLTDIWMGEDNGFPILSHFQHYGADIPGDKCLYFINRPVNKSPHGTSELDPAYKHYIVSDKFVKYEAMFLERMGIPPMILKILGYHTNNLSLGKKVIQKLQRESGVVIDKNWELDVLETDRKGNSAFSGAIMYHDMMKLRAILFPAGLIDEGKSGTYGLGDIRFEIFKWITMNTREHIKHVLEKQLFNKWIAMIDPTAVSYGEWRWKPYQEIDWLKMGEGIKDFVDCGIIDPINDADYVRTDILGLDSMSDIDKKNETDETKEYLNGNVRKVFPSTVIRKDAMEKIRVEEKKVDADIKNMEKESSNNDRESEQEPTSTDPREV